jgi:ABC-type nitrate/sulfonate/bicarbonate transport system substrate-binding protein
MDMPEVERHEMDSRNKRQKEDISVPKVAYISDTGADRVRRHRAPRIAVGLLSVGLLLGSLLVLTSGGSATASAGPSTAKASGLVVVKVGLTPYFESQPFVIAHQLGLDKAQGLDFQFVSLTADGGPVGSALLNGTIDIGSSCISCDLPILKSVPALRDFMITNQFGGFIVIGRKGAPTYASLAKKYGSKVAESDILHSFVGKTFDLVVALFEPLLYGALKQVGIAPSAVTVDDFSTDPLAATAFEHGVGQYYMGSLPEELSLLYGSPSKYIDVGGSQILGPGGLWYSTMVSTQAWLSANPQTALKIMAIWYRTMRYLTAYPAVTYPIWTKAINTISAASYTASETQFITTHLEDYETIPQAEKLEFNSSLGLYWTHSLTYYVNSATSDIPSGTTASTYFVLGKYFDKLLKDHALLAWVNSPLTKP